MKLTDQEFRDTLRRLMNLVIFFDSLSRRSSSSRNTDRGEPPKAPIKEIYKTVVGYRFLDSPWFSRERSKNHEYPEWTPELAIRLINHDVKILQKCGFPIRYDATQGKERVLWLEPQETLPAITFTPQEAALLGALGRRGTDNELSMFVRNGWSKVLPDTPFEDHEESFIYTPPEDVHESEVFEAIHSAIVNRKRLIFDYRSRPKAQIKRRTLDPWAIVTSEDRVYVVGFDLDSQETRCFRFNHIQKPKALSHNQEHLGTPEKVKKAFQTSMSRAPQVSVIYRGDYALWPDDTGIQGAHHQWQSSLMDRDLAVRFFAAQAPEVEVLEPKDFREDVIEFLQEFQC